MLKVICIPEGRELGEGAGQQQKGALDLTWVRLSHRFAFRITRAASIKSWGLCTYRGVSMESSRKPDVN